MSDWIDRALEQSLRDAFVREETADWAAIAGRVRRRRSVRALRVLALAGAVALLVVTTALGVTPGVGSLFGGNAPMPVKAGFNNRFVNLGVDPATIRLGAQVRMQDGTLLRLWTGYSARTSSTCVQFQVGPRITGAVACGRVTPHTVGTYLMGSVSRARLPTQHEAMAIGGVAPARTARVRLGFADGTTRSAKATGGAWVAEIPWALQRYDHDLVSVQALDAADHPIATQHRPAAVRPAHPIAPYATVATFAGRPLRAAPGSNGTTCIDFQRSDGIGESTCSDASRGTGAWIVRLAPAGKPGRLVLFGFLPRNATAARVTFSDGHTRVAPRRHGVFALQLAGELEVSPVRLSFRTLHGDGAGTLSLRGPQAGGLYRRAWHGARYTKVAFGRMNTMNYVVGRLQWPDGHLTPTRP